MSIPLESHVYEQAASRLFGQISDGVDAGTKMLKTAFATSSEVINIIKKENGKTTLNKDALERVLGNPTVAKYPVAVYSVAGPFRTGKSFLFNLFVRYLEGKSLNPNDKDQILGPFKFRGGASERCTEGIWITTEPYIISTQQNGEVALFLMDTQGSFDHMSSTEESAILLALSLLLSSYQFFNLKDKIDSLYLQALSKFAEYATKVKDTKYSCPFQDFMFLIRDWEMVDDHSHGVEGGNSYLKTVLHGNGAQEHIDTKTLLEETFSGMSCFLWPSPGPNVKRMGSKLKACSVHEIDVEFLKTAVNFFSTFYDENSLGLGNVKKIDNEVVTCEQLHKFAIEFADVINSESTESVESYLEAGKAAKMELLVFKCVNIYTKHLQKCHETSLEYRHEKSEKEAFDAFRDKSKYSKEKIRMKGQKKLQEEIDKIYVVEQNKEKNDKLAEECIKMYQTGMGKNFTDLFEFQKIHDEMQEKVNSYLETNLVEIDSQSLIKAKSNLTKNVLLIFKAMKTQVDQRHLEKVSNKLAHSWLIRIKKPHSENFEEHSSQVQDGLFQEFNKEIENIDENLHEDGRMQLKIKIDKEVEKYLAEEPKAILGEECRKHKEKLKKMSRFTSPKSLKKKQQKLLKSSRKRTNANLDDENAIATLSCLKEASESTYEEMKKKNKKFKMVTGGGVAGVGVALGLGSILVPPLGIIAAAGVVGGGLYALGAKKCWW
ncbi:atlastin-1-like [Clavelina lepadiformis]|uniref:atlastin-1-like n=1 Tax=Clavelina lepadiformis TaxID=159417 RepID=UPI004041B414